MFYSLSLLLFCLYNSLAAETMANHSIMTASCFNVAGRFSFTVLFVFVSGW